MIEFNQIFIIEVFNNAKILIKSDILGSFEPCLHISNKKNN